MQSYEKRQWEVREFPFRPWEIAHKETIFTIGNGLIGTRGSFEEGYPGDSATTLAAGIFNHKEGEIIPELAAIPNWLSLSIKVNGETCLLHTGKIHGFERTLDMRTATLSRGVLWQSPKGTLVRLRFERFASLANQHVLAIKVIVQVLSAGTHRLEITSALDGNVTNPAIADPHGRINHWAQMKGVYSGDTLTLHGITDQSGYHIAMHSHLSVSGAKAALSDASIDGCPAHTASFEAAQNQEITLTKLVAFHTTRDTSDPASAADATLTQAIAEGYDAIKAAHDEAWAQTWEAFDIVIEGDEVAQRAVRFCAYHVLIATPTRDERVSIGAKTLSGFGYRGHVFWDTELFMLPMGTLAHPDMARRLLMYRYHNLQGARNKAAEAGYEGACFPWESTDTGEETTPRWVGTKENPIRIWTGDNEQHITSDLVYALLQYWQWTGDDAWFTRYGSEIVLDTAKFWASRAEFNAEKNRYELKMQIGPDEYHENIDNSVFTNYSAAWNLREGLKTWEWLNQHAPQRAAELAAQLDITPDRLAKWQDVADRLWIPMADQGSGAIFEQFENFFKMDSINLDDYKPKVTNMDVILGHDTKHTQVIKQADVVMLMALFGEALGDREFLRRNWDTYIKVVDHGSSLSPATHSQVAARLGLIDQAYDLFLYSATLDLDDNKGNVRDGIHAAACGGTWQAVLWGFCGLHLTPEGPKVNPALPKHWKRVAFNVVWRGQRHSFEIKADA